MSNVYISRQEFDELLQTLTTTEARLYNLIHSSILENPDVEYFSDSNLSAVLNVPPGTIANAKSGLKQKGYMLLVRFKDDRGTPCIRVIVGKEQVELYNMGITTEITNIKAYNKLKQQFKLLDPTLSAEEKTKAVEAFNAYYDSHKTEFE
jgi:hypothetical protein